MVSDSVDQKIKSTIGDLLGRADPVSKKVLTAFDPSKDPGVNKRSLLKFSRPDLEVFAEFLSIQLEDSRSKAKLFSNREKLVNHVVLRITALYPSTCSECSSEYQVKFGTTPALRCFICSQGSHDCNEVTALIETLRTVPPLSGSVWLCSGCYNANNLSPIAELRATPPSASATPTSTNPPSRQEPCSSNNLSGEDNISTEELANKLNVVVIQQTQNQDTPPDTETIICPKFVAGECPHGFSGKTPKNGVAKCELRHPKRCRKHMKFGADPEHGCNLGDSCDFYHIPHCSSSLKDKTCYNKDCNRVHLVGTKRPKREKNTTPPGGGTRQARPQTNHSVPSQSRSQKSSTRPPPSRDGRSQRPVPNKPSEKATAENDNRFLELRTLMEAIQKEMGGMKTEMAEQRNIVEEIRSRPTPLPTHSMPVLQQPSMPAPQPSASMLHSSDPYRRMGPPPPAPHLSSRNIPHFPQFPNLNPALQSTWIPTHQASY